MKIYSKRERRLMLFFNFPHIFYLSTKWLLCFYYFSWYILWIYTTLYIIRVIIEYLIFYILIIIPIKKNNSINTTNIFLILNKIWKEKILWKLKYLYCYYCTSGSGGYLSSNCSTSSGGTTTNSSTTTSGGSTSSNSSTSGNKTSDISSNHSASQFLSIFINWS